MAEDSAAPEMREILGVSEGETRLPGVGLAEGVSQITGVAISPLLGVSAIGSWTWFRTEAEDRGRLPWICHPGFWGTTFAILLICFFKDSIGNLAPAFVKKPIDFLELFEDKVSAIIAGGALVPFLVEQYGLYRDGIGEVAISESSDFVLATIPTPFLGLASSTWVLLPVALSGFIVVWIVSHSLTVIIALSPFKLLDAFLKAARLFLLTGMAAVYLVSPVIVALFSCALVVVCAFLAPTAFRISVFGTVVSSDFLHSLFWKTPLREDRIHCFLAKQGNESIKVRSLGRVALTPSGRIEFRSRFLFLGPERRLLLPGNGALVVSKGYLFPSLGKIHPKTGRVITIIHLLPRFRHCVDELANHLRLDCRETSIVRGLRAAREWFRDNVFVGRKDLPSDIDSEKGEEAVSG